MTIPETYDLTGKIIDFENGELDEDQTIELFQHMVDTGIAWKLQGRIGRQAYRMAEEGLITIPEGSRDYYGNRIEVRK